MRILMCMFLILSSLVAAQSAPADSRQEVYSYIDQYKEIAIEEMLRTGIPASIKMAQAILESGAGRSYLATNANNHFGIKCGKYWDGPTSFREDDDFDHKGNLKKSCFRAYDDVASSFRAHSEFLMDPRKEYRYGFLFQLNPTDYEGWAHGLMNAGYATNPKYALILIKLIEDYRLYDLDQGFSAPVLTSAHEIEDNVHTINEAKARASESTRVDKSHTKSSRTTKNQKSNAKVKSKTDFIGIAKSYTVRKQNNIRMIKADAGDDLSLIALEMGLDIQDLLRFNDYIYSSDQVLEDDAVVYLASKKSKYKGQRSTHRVKQGDSMEKIAQQYGIKLNALYKRNKMKSGTQPKVGAKIYLSGRKKS